MVLADSSFIFPTKHYSLVDQISCKTKTHQEDSGRPDFDRQPVSKATKLVHLSRVLVA